MRYVFIPSCEVVAVNSLAGTVTEKRLSRGLALWNKGGFDTIIVSGGRYLSPSIQTTASGILMKQWLVQRGVPTDNVVCEDQSLDTFENISLSLKLLNEDAPEIVVVTHWQHALRIWVTFRLAHKLRVGILPMWYGVGIKTFFLEWLFFAIHIFDRHGVGWLSAKNRTSRKADAAG